MAAGSLTHKAGAGCVTRLISFQLAGPVVARRQELANHPRPNAPVAQRHLCAATSAARKRGESRRHHHHHWRSIAPQHWRPLRSSFGPRTFRSSIAAVVDCRPTSGTNYAPSHPRARTTIGADNRLDRIVAALHQPGPAATLDQRLKGVVPSTRHRHRTADRRYRTRAAASLHH